jgi:hypothetical protein
MLEPLHDTLYELRVPSATARCRHLPLLQLHGNAAHRLLWAIDSYLFRDDPGRVLRDEQTGERVLLVPKHDLRPCWASPPTPAPAAANKPPIYE